MRIQTNPDREFANDLRKEIKRNNGYCPSALEKTKDTKCMYKAFRDMAERGETGACTCGLYIITDE